MLSPRLFLRSGVLVWPGLNLHIPCAYPVELTSPQLSLFSFITCFILLPFQMVWEQGVVVIVNLTKLSDLGLVSAVLSHF